ncbi:hypothetical protein SSBG_06650 [Streptomyces sp. SPB074]|nr:hypothetical protein SSBG_06650 [Streptomyces sp. SPB074]
MLRDLLLGAVHRTTPTRHATTRRPDTSPAGKHRTGRPYPPPSRPRRRMEHGGRNLADQGRTSRFGGRGHASCSPGSPTA